MTVFRINKNKNYSVISNQFLNDDRLSWKAKGVLTWLLSRQDGWKPLLLDMQQRSKDGRDSTAAGINELVEHGYIVRDKIRDDKGLLKGYEYQVYEEPVNGLSATEKPNTDISNTEKPTLINTDKVNTDKLSTKEVNKRVEFDYTGFTELENESIKKWLQYKKERNQAYKSTGLATLRTKLLELHSRNQLINAIDNSIANNWSGIFEDQNMKAKTSNHDLSKQNYSRGAEILGHKVNNSDKPF
jgi:hypothetical protein